MKCRPVTLKLLKFDPSRVIIILKEALEAEKKVKLPPERLQRQQQQQQQHLSQLTQLLPNDIHGARRGTLPVGKAKGPCESCRHLIGTKTGSDPCDQKTPMCGQCFSKDRIDCKYRVKDTAHLFESKSGAQQSQDQEHQILGQPGPSTQPGWRQESPMQLDSPVHPHSGRSNRTSRSSSQSQPQTPGMTAENIALLLAFNQGGPSQAENQSEQNLPVPTSQSTLHAAASHPSSSTHPTHSNHPAQTSSSKGKRTEREKSSSSDQESTRSPRDSQKKPSKKGRTKK
jgi:hypothetical protein